MSIVCWNVIFGSVLQRYLWEAILSQNIYTAVEQIFKPMLIVLPFYCKITCYNCHASYWLADNICYWHVHTTDNYWHRIRYWHFYTTEQNVAGILIPWDDMLLTFLYHGTIRYWHSYTMGRYVTDTSIPLTVCYWHIHTTDSMLLTEYVHTTDSMSIPLRDGLLRFLYHKAICWCHFYIYHGAMCWRYFYATGQYVTLDALPCC